MPEDHDRAPHRRPVPDDRPPLPPGEPPREPEQDEAPLPSTIGKGMTYAAWVLILVMLTALFSSYLREQRNPNANLQPVTDANGVPVVTLLRNRQGHYVAGARINGVPVEVLVDTGATTVTVPEPLARRLGLPRGRRVLATTANGTIVTYATRLDSVQLGGLIMHNVPATINPNHDEILLGMSFLKRLDFSQRGERLTLRPPGA